MTGRDYLVIALVIIAGALEYSWELFPENEAISPFLLQEKSMSLQWYILILSYNLRFIIFATCLVLVTKKAHYFTKEVLKLNIIAVFTSFIWFICFKDNMFSVPEVYLKLSVVAILYIITFISIGLDNYFSERNID